MTADQLAPRVVTRRRLPFGRAHDVGEEHAAKDRLRRLGAALALDEGGNRVGDG